jgi:lipid-A-disaccharide synthase
MEKTLDALGVIFPFETKCYEDVKLPVSFVGHPFMSEGSGSRSVIYDPTGPLLLLPGSRIQAVERILPVLVETFESLQVSHPEIHACIPAANPKIYEVIQKIIESRRTKIKNISVTGETKMLKASLALMSSGTMSLRCALSGIPGAIVYKAHPLTFFLGKMLVKVPHLGMANLLLPQSPPYPEFIQGQARADLITHAIQPMLSDRSQTIATYRQVAEQLREILQAPQENGVAEWLLGAGELR